MLNNLPGMEDIDFKKLKATMEAAKKAEDQIQKTGEMAYNQIVSFLGKERMGEFLGLKTNEERISFMYRHEAYRPLLQTIKKGAGSSGKGEKDAMLSRQMRDAGNTASAPQSAARGPGPSSTSTSARHWRR